MSLNLSNLPQSPNLVAKLPRTFYARPTLEVAPQLLGKLLVYESPQGRLSGEINEVEAYLGQEDPASHAFRGPSPRTQVMFGEAGFIYMYQIYGLHFCMNVVCEEKGVAGAVLLRSIIPRDGIWLMEQNRQISGKNLTNGPAKLCQALGLTRVNNGFDLVDSDQIWLEDQGKHPQIVTSLRVGISQAKDKPWRFTIQI